MKDDYLDVVEDGLESKFVWVNGADSSVSFVVVVSKDDLVVFERNLEEVCFLLMLFD